jgi:hypothetical protein
VAKKPKKAKAKRVVIKRVKLPATGILRVEVPKDVAPVVVARDSHLEIAPIKKEKEFSWMDFLFGTSKQ